MCIRDRFNFRKDVIEGELKAADIKLEELDCVVGRGGLLKPIKGGTSVSYTHLDVYKRQLSAIFIFWRSTQEAQEDPLLRD